ncbi:putative small secreted protein [Azospirillum agricola]|uniref:hypothetical protein n=1 Tax=Azospirillum agricola TaxID=1720247 RepID=UPI001AE2C73C|nr:hypothetical protein [Azospirillum agricola]MBP2232171.1 putative small secreted protein [Azospirillum agricola]
MMTRWVLLVCVSTLLAGCGVVSGAASVAGTAVSLAGTAVETTADVVTAPIR